MRICSILLENLNSLVGIWSVNFRSPSYGESGLFAITGPTGAGKSTLLDALCLGLYGRTPRLESISKKTNEVMSRQKGECRAEVVFEVPRGIFKASWGQHRADKNPRGKLQQPWRELANCGTGEILASSVEGVKTGVEELTGMDFHRFTRSVLLAQGGFASFLKASPSEKAPLLEQITGTDLYSRFSIYVHERHKREEELLREIESRSGGILLLSPEERKALETERLGVLEEETKLDFREKELRRGKEWREKLQALEEELREAEKDALLLEDRRRRIFGGFAGGSRLLPWRRNMPPWSMPGKTGRMWPGRWQPWRRREKASKSFGPGSARRRNRRKSGWRGPGRTGKNSVRFLKNAAVGRRSFSPWRREKKRPGKSWRRGKSSGKNGWRSSGIWKKSFGIPWKNWRSTPNFSKNIP